MSEPPRGSAPYVLGPPGPPPGPPPKRRKAIDRTAGIVLGVIAGLAVVAVFVFFGSDGAIDASSVSGVTTGKQAPPPQAEPLRPQQAGR